MCPCSSLILGKPLGQGAFGQVVRAEALSDSDKDDMKTAAVKMLKGVLNTKN